MFSAFSSLYECVLYSNVMATPPPSHSTAQASLRRHALDLVRLHSMSNLGFPRLLDAFCRCSSCLRSRHLPRHLCFPLASDLALKVRVTCPVWFSSQAVNSRLTRCKGKCVRLRLDSSALLIIDSAASASECHPSRGASSRGIYSFPKGSLSALK